MTTLAYVSELSITLVERLKRATILLVLASLVLTLVGFILTVKAATATDMDARPFLFFYSLFITSFIFSRITAAALWKEPTKSITLELLASYEPSVSIVIPCKNEEADIEDTVRKSFSAHYPRHLLEVIVINDGSTDGTIGVLRRVQKEFPELTIVDWKVNRGKRHGMAEGFRRAKGEIIVQLDSDSFIVPETFRELILPFANPRIGAVSAHAEPTNRNWSFLSKMQAAYYGISFRIFKAAESSFNTVFCCSGCSSAYRKSVALPILDRWLGEKFLGKPVTWGDDRSLTSWVLRGGSETTYTFRARAFTIVPWTFRQLLIQQIRWKKSWIINSVLTAKFIWKERPFVAFTYFFPLIFVTLTTPIIAIRTFVYTPIVTGTFPTLYIFGVLLIALLVVVCMRLLSREKTMQSLYFLPWSILNMLFMSALLFYAMVTIQDRGWGTR
ncbi:MAG: Glycosyl transferase family 2 [Parcubacteria group bacterium GW2011_GWA2_47_7]|nr:MAG: Glycosyl transferase family 2 [Parcubacteria group bacterium GW2011_GWA2_47_7]